MLRKWKAKQKYAKNATAKLMRGVVGVTGAAEAAAQAEDEAEATTRQSHGQDSRCRRVAVARSLGKMKSAQDEKDVAVVLGRDLAVPADNLSLFLTVSLSLALASFINIILIWVSETTWRSSLNLAASCQQSQAGSQTVRQHQNLPCVFF